MREYKVQRKVITILQKHDAYYIRVAQASKAGVPDVVACVCGLFVAIECKGTNGRVDPLQDFNIRKIRKSKGVALVIGPDELDVFESLIISLIEGKGHAAIP
jgi:Holliday junction resolvase